MNWAVRRGLMLAMAGILLLIPAMVWAQDKQEPLKAELTAHKTSGTLYEKFRFTVKARGGQAPYQYLWLGKYKRKASVDIDFRSPGNKSIWVLVKDAAGNSFRVAKQIVVRPQECRVSIRPTPGPNHFNQRDVVVMMGELVDLRAMVQGCRWLNTIGARNRLQRDWLGRRRAGAGRIGAGSPLSRGTWVPPR
jgi:hypothetical protein